MKLPSQSHPAGLRAQGLARGTPVTARPYLSLVTYSRNDDHGGNLAARMRTCIEGFIAQAERHRLRSELVLVEWNPPEDRPLLQTAFPWPRNLEFCTIRTITVPPSIHRHLPESDKTTVHNALARNTGIRRARGAFVLSTGIDVLFSDELIAFLAREQLRDDRLYRVDRTDVRMDVVSVRGLAEQLAYCRSNVMRVRTFRRWVPEFMFARIPPLHIFYCGDFQLLSRERWLRLHGYPEINPASYHVDSILTYMAHLSGAHQQVLRPPLCLYHVDHESSSTPRNTRWDRLLLRYVRPHWVARKLVALKRVVVEPEYGWDVKGVQYLRWRDAARIIAEMVRGRRPLAFNDDAWGLAGEALPECTIARARSWDV